MKVIELKRKESEVRFDVDLITVMLRSIDGVFIIAQFNRFFNSNGTEERLLFRQVFLSQEAALRAYALAAMPL